MYQRRALLIIPVLMEVSNVQADPDVALPRTPSFDTRGSLRAREAAFLKNSHADMAFRRCYFSCAVASLAVHSVGYNCRRRAGRSERRSTNVSAYDRE